ncbi:hypothetical protein [Floridanema evergladense]|uniref:Uncharacterized protein n=1 Tax=Floridaenema evergladense BLCC-F167 TaxID=3153639 RepID=A0ABV4WD17_9CYAN
MASTPGGGGGSKGGKKGRGGGGAANPEPQQPKSEIKPFESPRRRTIKNLEETLGKNVEQVKPSTQSPTNKKPSKLRQSLNRARAQADKVQQNVNDFQKAVKDESNRLDKTAGKNTISKFKRKKSQ